MNAFLSDLKHAARLYKRTPATSLLAIIVLAVALAFFGAFLSLYVDLALKPYAGYEQSDQLVTISRSDGTESQAVAYEMIERLSSELNTIEAAAIFSYTTTLVQPNLAETQTGLVSREFFEGLRPRLALGRGFRADDHDPQSEPAVVLSHRLWQQQFNGDRGILDDFLVIERNPANQYLKSFFQPDAEPDDESARFRIVGVLAREFPGLPALDGMTNPEIWMPMERAWTLFVGTPETLPSAVPRAFARRAQGATAADVADELRTRFPGLDPVTNRPGAELDAFDGLVSHIPIQRETKRQLEMFLAGSVLLAIVAGANVSLFLLARAPGRRRELAIRMAVGAPIRRLARQLATEAGFLVVLSGILGLLGSIWLSLHLKGLELLQAADWNHVTFLDWRVLSLTALFLLTLTLVISLAPILGIKRFNIAATSRQATSRASITQRVFGSAQLAATGALGGAAIAFALHLGMMMFGDPGFNVGDRYWVQAQSQNLAMSQDARTIETTRWRESVESIPGVHAIAFGQPVPFANQIETLQAVPHPTDSSNQIGIRFGEIDQSLVDVLGLKLAHGRAPMNSEPNVIAINQTLAQMVWGRDDVVGEVLSGSPLLGNIMTGAGSEIVGVLQDVSFGHPSAPVEPYAFRGYTTLRSGIIESELSRADLEQALLRLDPTELDVRINNVQSLRSMRNELLAPDRARTFLTLGASTLVVVLTALSFYGTQRYLVEAGRREYAIRASLGAGPRSLGRLVLKRGMQLALPGLVVGTLLGYIAAVWLQRNYLSSELSASLATAWLVIGLVLVLLISTVGPARQAMLPQVTDHLRED